MLDYPALAAVAAIARTGSFEAAAAQLRVTPSAISQRVKGLEERLGAPLIVRTSPCTATPAGARLCAHYEQVVLLERDMLSKEESRFAEQAERSPPLRVAVNSDSLASWFPVAMADFTARASVTFDLVLDDEAHTAARLRSGEVLAAVTTTGKPVQGCKTVELGSMRYLATAAPAYRDRYLPGRLTKEALAQAPVLRFDHRDDLQNRWMAEAVGTVADPPTHWVPSTRGFLDLTLAGVGWSLTPEALAAPFLAEGRLVELKPGVNVEVPLFWQQLRISAGLLDALTRAVRGAAAGSLVAP